MSNIEIALFLFNRPKHTEQMLQSLIECKNVEFVNLNFFIDGPRNEQDLSQIVIVESLVRKYCAHLKFNIIKQRSNEGLANSIIYGVSEIFEKADSVIVIEDDLILHNLFIEYMSRTLDFYKNSTGIFSISGYSPLTFPTHEDFRFYLSPRIHSWGWGTWKNRWSGVDWELRNIGDFLTSKVWIDFFSSGGPDLIPMLRDQLKGNINSWAIRFNLEAAKLSNYTLYPSKTLVLNRGFDGTGVHCGFNESIQSRSFEKYVMLPENFYVPFPKNQILSDFFTHYKNQ